MNTHIQLPFAQTFDIETHLQTARSLVRAIMLSANSMAIDRRDAAMLDNLTSAINEEFDGIDRLMGIDSSGAES